MNTRSKILTGISALVVAFSYVGNVQADDTDGSGMLHYDNRAFVHAIHSAPNPAKDTKIEFAKIAYADKAYGQAIYSYPSNVAFQETAFNVEYIDTAHGQAIYGYPNNNPVQHHLELSADTQSQENGFIVPVVLKGSDIPKKIANP